MAQTPTLLGDLDADTKPTVIDLQRLLNHINSSQLSTPPLSTQLLPYADLNEDGIINTNDVLLLQDAILGRSALPNPYAAPILNAPVVATNGSSISISGVARPNRRIVITGGRLAVFVNSDSNGLFTAEVQLRTNQVNAIYVTVTNATFTAGIPQPLRILQDSQPPSLYIDFPTNGQTLYTSNTVIAGRVGDMLSGFMGLNVTVGTSSTSSPTSSFPANVNVGIGNNGTYERSLVPLAPGTNLITVTATDIHGNSTFRVIRVFRGQLTGPRLEVVWGDMQATNIHRRLAQPIIVRALQANGTPFANKLVTFEVTRSDGRLLPVNPTAAANPAALTNDITRTPHGIMSLQLYTDASGEARAWWALGGDAGSGNNRVCAMSAGISNAVYFCASARAAAVHQINIGTGNNQKAETGGFVPEPLRAWVSDRCNGIEGLPITFTIIQGGGRLVGMTSTSSQTNNSGTGMEPVPTTSLTVPSTRTGHAEALLQLGPDAGQNIIEANYPGNPNLPATFIAYGVARDPSQPTRLSGLVLDNTSCPLGGAACSVSVGGQLFFTTTDVQGQFHFTNTPAGPAFLNVNGSTATNLLGATIPTNSFPSLEFALILIPNAGNSLPSPVLLPRLSPLNSHLYLGTNDLVLTCEGMEGLKMTIKVGSMRKPDGSLVTPANPAYVSLNQVHHDSVPMPIPDGASPPFAWTLQPGGATFDPPITIEYPNMSGLPAGTVAYFLSFNHDTRRFEIVASGHVTDDSATILTDPGAGLSIAGWGCNCPPYSVTGDCANCLFRISLDQSNIDEYLLCIDRCVSFELISDSGVDWSVLQPDQQVTWEVNEQEIGSRLVRSIITLGGRVGSRHMRDVFVRADYASGGLVQQRTIRITVVDMELAINGTTKRQPNSDDDFVIVSAGLTIRPATELEVRVNAPRDFAGKVYFKQRGSGLLTFEKQSMDVRPQASNKLRLYGDAPSLAKDDTSIEARFDEQGDMCIEETVTIIHGVQVVFEGNFQCRLAMDDDPSAATEPFIGLTRFYAGDLPFDRIIRLSRPVDLRETCFFVPVQIVRIEAIQPPGASFSNGDVLLGQFVNLGPRSYFDGNRTPGDWGREPIANFQLQIGDGMFSATSSEVLAGTGLENTGNRGDINGRIRALNNAMAVVVDIPRWTRLRDRKLALSADLFQYERVYNYLAKYPGILDQEIALSTDASNLLRYAANFGSFPIGLTFSQFDWDCLTGWCKGIMLIGP